jgi:hypothetical protein
VIRVNLPESEADRLEQAFLQTTDRKHLDRLQIIRSAHRGRLHQEIAADLGITPGPSGAGSTPTATGALRA